MSDYFFLVRPHVPVI